MPRTGGATEECDDDERARRDDRGHLAARPEGRRGPGRARRAGHGGRAFDAAGLDDGSRVVELAPGLGLASETVLSRDPRTWTAVEPDPLAAEHLRRSRAARGGLPIPGREAPTQTRHVVEAPVTATGLEDGSATVVVDRLPALHAARRRRDRRAVLTEAVRLLRTGGRVAVHDLAFAPDADPDARGRPGRRGHPSAGRGRAAGARSRRWAWWSWARSSGALHLPPVHDVMREAGPRLGLKITRGVALDGGLRTAALAGKQALPRRAVSLRSLVVVGEVPLILGMRRPRR